MSGCMMETLFNERVLYLHFHHVVELFLSITFNPAFLIVRTHFTQTNRNATQRLIVPFVSKTAEMDARYTAAFQVKGKVKHLILEPESRTGWRGRCKVNRRVPLEIFFLIP